ncbi:putative endopeptidase [Lutibacter agarilyticus]|uniref:Putative endopeptidase n=1 Tax=Lutibacter agarilyticus TaxID=1109740 RepID=A0A238YHQ5_9FLAO|nr:M13 family metallopeptidase [Lutibacter agarilyticus]SNR70123.1 putative endopeptidase [Lutibacter agarilyticus]
MEISFKKLMRIASVAFIATLASCGSNAKVEEEQIPGIIVENMDTSVRPNDDFFRYVNGTWFDKTEIPADRTSWGGFNELRKNTDEDVLQILNEAIIQDNFPKLKDAQGNLTLESDQKKAVNFYESIMDTVARDAQGIEPIKPFLAKIDAVQNLVDLETLLIEMAPYGGAGFFDFSVFNDLKDSKMNAGYISAAGLGLSRDYYVDQDENTKGKRVKYIEHIARMLQFFGDTAEEAAINADKIFKYEYNLAEPRLTKEESRDTRKLYNPKTMDELTALVPSIHWDAYFKGLGIDNLERVIVMQPKYMEAVNTILTSNSIEDVKLYLRWTAIDRAAGKLNREIENANWDFYSKELRGAKQQLPRDERALASLNGNIGEALGKLYVDAKFPPEAKAKAEEMIANVMLGFEKRINALEWMSPETKLKAIEKLNKMTVKIAYPDTWKDYSTLDVKGTKDGGSYFQNSINISKWNFNKDIEKLGKEVDRSEWGMAPQIVNAYFNPVNNEIVFPAAILQPPFYNYTADEAVNYGGIGAVIGHEISHCFDDQGARFDADGNLSNWWTEEDAAQFAVLGKKLVDQYSNVVAIGDVNLNGEFTLGENIGDLGGINAAYDGLQIFYEKNGRPADIDGFTAEQRFYMSWGTIWRTKTRDEALKNQIKTDPHAPGFYRAFMPLQNVDAFYTAFNIVEGDEMYLKPEDRVKIW